VTHVGRTVDHLVPLWYWLVSEYGPFEAPRSLGALLSAHSTTAESRKNGGLFSRGLQLLEGEEMNLLGSHTQHADHRYVGDRTTAAAETSLAVLTASMSAPFVQIFLTPFSVTKLGAHFITTAFLNVAGTKVTPRIRRSI
jgi:hypothetical protein